MMKAWRLYAFDDLRLDEVPLPQVKPGWVLAKTRVVQLSVTEVWRAKGVGTAGYDAIKKKLEEEGPQQLFGHEFCAEVVELGPGVEGFAVGDRICAGLAIPCHSCASCLEGRPEFCRDRRVIGTHLPGFLAEYGLVPAEVLTKLPDSISDSEAAALQPLAASVNFVAAAHMRMGDTCVVIGPGAMGLGCIQAARVSGAGSIIAVGRREEGLALARRFGADVLVDARHIDPVQAVLESTRGKGAEVVIEAAGGGPAGLVPIQQATGMVRPGGKIVQVGDLGSGGQMNFGNFARASVHWIFTTMITRAIMQHTVRLLETEQITVKPMIKHILEGIDKVPEAIEITADKAKHGAINPAQVRLS